MNDEREAAGKPSGSIYLQLPAHDIRNGAVYHGCIDPAFFKYMPTLDDPGLSSSAFSFGSFPFILPEFTFAIRFFKRKADRILEIMDMIDPSCFEIFGGCFVSGVHLIYA
jgi:hypothetical protein